MTQVEFENNAHLEQFLISGGSEMEKRVEKIVRQVLLKARNRVSRDIRGSLGSDPRQAYRAVKHMVYKRILGGNISILNKRRRSGKMAPLPTNPDRKGKRGGNRTPRTKRTEDLITYWGTDRGFILRFLNSGTDQRQSRYGNRGSIPTRNFFASAGQEEMEAAAQQLSELIEQEFNNTFR